MSVRLSRVTLTNYRSCLHTSLSLDKSLSTLIGVNGSGKTNILHGILLLHQLSRPHHRPRSTGSISNRCRLSCEFAVRGKRLKYRADITFTTGRHNEEEIASVSEAWTSADFLGSKEAVQFPISFREIAYYSPRLIRHLNRSQRLHFPMIRHMGSGLPRGSDRKYTLLLTAIKSVAEFVSSIRYYSAAQFTNPVDCPPAFYMEQEGPSQRAIGAQREHARLMADLYSTYKNDPAAFQEYMSVVGKDGVRLFDAVRFKEVLVASNDVDVRIGGRVVKRRVRRRLVIPSFYFMRHKFSPSQLSEGTFKTMGLLYYLLTSKSRLLLIEEPEVCVHHGLLATIVELTKSVSNRKQIVMSTHSDYVLDKLTPEAVFLVRHLGEKGTSATRIPEAISKDSYAALKEYLRASGNLGDYWRQGALDNV
jgi:ABC-type Mn2+/Zn2+ transport system ATPase subunit